VRPGTPEKDKEARYSTRGPRTDHATVSKSLMHEGGSSPRDCPSCRAEWTDWGKRVGGDSRKEGVRRGLFTGGGEEGWGAKTGRQGKVVLVCSFPTVQQNKTRAVEL